MYIAERGEIHSEQTTDIVLKDALMLITTWHLSRVLFGTNNRYMAVMRMRKGIYRVIM